MILKEISFFASSSK